MKDLTEVAAMSLQSETGVSCFTEMHGGNFTVELAQSGLNEEIGRDD